MKGYRRNGAPAREGIDTVIIMVKVIPGVESRNGALAREGIDTQPYDVKKEFSAKVEMEL